MTARMTDATLDSYDDGLEADGDWGDDSVAELLAEARRARESERIMRETLHHIGEEMACEWESEEGGRLDSCPGGDSACGVHRARAAIAAAESKT